MFGLCKIEALKIMSNVIIFVRFVH